MIRVLLLNDFPCERMAIQSVLGPDAEIELVDPAESGEGALELVHRFAPDVVMVDMPPATPRFLRDLVRGLGATRPLVWTADEDPDSLLEAAGAGAAAGYLSKHASADELRHAIVAVHRGGSVVTPSLAARLLRAYAASGAARAGADLSPRERETAELVAGGRSDREIAEELGLSVRTVQNHLAEVRRKTGFRRRAEIARWLTRAVAS